MKLDYQIKLENWLAELPPMPQEITSGSEVKKPYSDDLKKDPISPATLAALDVAYPTNKTFKKYTGTSQVTLLRNWAKGGILTTCNSFAGNAGREMGAKEFLGQFELKAFLNSKGKGYAYVEASSGRKPNYGDIFRSESFHMGVSLGFDSGGNWLTAEGGQGGPGRGCDVVKRKSSVFKPWALKGWCDMRCYLLQTPPMPDWLIGTWAIFSGSETHTYEINAYGEVNYYPWKFSGSTEIIPATDTGQVKMQGMDDFTITWKKEKKEGVVEKFKYERFDSFPGINEKISGFSSQNEPLKGVRM